MKVNTLFVILLFNNFNIKNITESLGYKTWDYKVFEILVSSRVLELVI